MSFGAHAYEADPRNASVLVSVNGEVVPRAEAVVSVFDSNFMLGDGVWEGLRMKTGKIPFLRKHLERLYGGARVLDFENMIAPEEMRARIFDVLDANGMEDGVHIRLMVSRGVRSTPYQDATFGISTATHRPPPRIRRTLVSTPASRATTRLPGIRSRTTDPMDRS